MIMFVTMQDILKVNSMGGILCEMALGSEEKHSHKVSFMPQGNGKSSRSKGATCSSQKLALSLTC